MRRYFLLAFLALPGWAQQDFAEPTLGLLHDASSAALRPVRGVPGAATVGAAIGEVVDVRWALTHRQYALVSVAGSDSLLRVRLDGSVQALAGVPASVSHASLSTSGDAAVLIAGQRMIVLADLLSTPAVKADVEIEADVTAAAVSDGAGRVIVARPGLLRLFEVRSGEWRDIATPAQTAALAVSDSAIAYNDGDQIWRVDKQGSATLLAGGGDGVAAPAALRLEDKRVIVANAGARNVLVLGEERAAFECACEPSRLDPVEGGYRLTELGEGPVWMLETASMRVLFIPAPARESVE